MPAPIRELDVLIVPEPDDIGLGVVLLPPVEHAFAPFVGLQVADIDDAFLGEDLQDLDIADPGLDRLDPVEHRQPCAVGGDHPAFGVEKGEAVLDGLDRMPKAPFGDLDLFMRDAEVGFDAHVLVAHGLHFGAGVVDLVRQGPRVVSQLAVGGLQFRLFLFQQPFGGQSGTPFLCQLVGKRHAHPPTCRTVFGPQSGIVVNSRLTRVGIARQSASMAIAMPWPPPMHMVTSARLPPVRSSS